MSTRKEHLQFIYYGEQMKLIKNLGFDVYKKLDLLNKSTLNNFVPGNSPRQSLYKKDSSGFNEGTMFHSSMEFGLDNNPELVLSEYDAFRSNEAKIWKAKQEAAGKHVIKQDQMDAIKEARLMTIETIKSQIGIDIEDGKGDHELTGVTDTEKIRLDYTRPEAHFDWKSSASAKPYSCMKDIETYNYDLQSYLYAKVYQEITGEMKPFIFVFQEIKAPFNCTLVQISEENTPEAWALGKHKYDKALERMNSCSKSDSYVATMQLYMPPKYTLDKYGVEINPFS